MTVFDRVLVVMFENQYRSYVMQDPFMRKLASAGADMRNYFGAFHPSQTNYVASLAGEICGVTNDTPPVPGLPQPTLVDVLEPKNVSWRAYMEGYPGDPWQSDWATCASPDGPHPINEFPPAKGPLLSRYFRKHNAFASFLTIQADRDRWQNIVPEAAFWEDVGGGGLPQYAWFTPDIWNDGHYLYNTHLDTQPRTQLVPQISSWLEYVFLPLGDPTKVQGGGDSNQPHIGLGLDIDLLLRDPKAAWDACIDRIPPRTLIVITFDEADYSAVGYDTAYNGPNQVYTVLLGDMIPPGTVIDTPFNHYSLMKTVERNFGTADLGKNDRDANWFRFLWDESFAWQAPAPTGIDGDGVLGLAPWQDGACVVFGDADGTLCYSDLAAGRWSVAAAIGCASGEHPVLANVDGRLLLVFAGEYGELCAAHRDPDGAWSAAEPLGQRTSGSLALTAYVDTDTGAHRAMLCWRSENDFIRFLTYANGEWSADAGDAVGQLTDGPMTLAQMGPSLYLVYKERNTRKMRMTSYNLASFNAFDAQDFNGNPAPLNDTSQNRWAPADFPVGHFAGKMATLQNDYHAVGRLAMATIEGEMHLVHRGAYQDTLSALKAKNPQTYSEVFGLTGVFTAADQSTNGYGTLAQAGWTLEQALPGVELGAESGLAVCRYGEDLLLVWQPLNGTGLMYRTGGYRRG